MRAGVLKAAAVGLAAGFVGGLFGVGGGIVMVPGLVLWIGLSHHRASATSVAAIVAASAAALTSFVVDDSVDWTAALIVFAGSGVGAILGTRFMGRIPEFWLSATFAAVLLLAAVRMAL